jgi:hypothetical protein
VRVTGLPWRHYQLNRAPIQGYHIPAPALRIAGLSGFFTLIQSRDGPDRFGQTQTQAMLGPTFGA